MKAAVINFSGNVGKTTVARHLLSPRMNNAEVISIESINADEGENGAIKGKQFGYLQEALVLVDDAVVDVGASNVEDFVNLMNQYKGSHEDFDYFVVPTVPDRKQMRDTIGTIDALSEMGVPAEKIRLVFNMVPLNATPDEIFAGLFEYHAKSKAFTLNRAAVIRVNDIYGKLGSIQQTISEVLSDPIDYKEKIKTATNTDEKLKYSNRLGIKRLSVGVTEDLDAVFKALVK